MEQFNKEYDYLCDLIDENLTYFYQQNLKIGFEKLNSVIEQIILVTEQLKISNLQKYLSNETILNKIFIKISNAINKKDVILLSDLLKYELLDIMKDCIE